MTLTTIKKGGHYYLAIPYTQGVKKFLIDGKIIKQYGKVFSFPMVFQDAYLKVHKDTVKLKHKKHWKVVSLKGDKLGYPNAIILVSVPEEGNVSIDEKNRVLIISLPKKKKVSVVVLGDGEKPVPIRALTEIFYWDEYGEWIDYLLDKSLKTAQKSLSFSEEREIFLGPSNIGNYVFSGEVDLKTKSLTVKVRPKAGFYSESFLNLFEEFLKENGMVLHKKDGFWWIDYPDKDLQFWVKGKNLNGVEMLARFGIALFPNKERRELIDA